MSAVDAPDASFEPEHIVEEVFEGEATGVEVEPDQPPPHEGEIRPWDPEKIRVTTRQFALRNVLDMIDDEDLELAPDFQRNRVWKPRQKSRLIESLLLQIPLPAFYFAEDEAGLLRVVDGLQRLSTIHDFVRKLSFALDDLEYLDEDGKKFDSLTPPLRRRLLNTQIVVHVIDPSTPNDVKYNIFKRINTGGEPLNAMEIRHCMSRDRSRKLLKLCASNPSFHAATGGVLRDHVRMNDREAVLRFIAFRRLTDIGDYDRYGSLENLLDRTVELIDTKGEVSDAQVGEWFEEFVRAMDNARLVFGPHAFRKWPRSSDRLSPINRALFESWAVVLADYEPAQLESVRTKIVKRARSAMTEDQAYIASISASTSDPQRVRTRFAKPRNIMKDVGL
ncbi:Protein of unknown function DUF262 [Nocardia amikacinitolerans]|uniref:GmrSD restriction endonucleases N-terminal domain-containing protein n=1 Tax=Nocardia amikacinitolerans TaxID=756689 RepID=A0A285LSP6_9NOCA|nr:DUF262 domain-containing protein [Nocardia amikacinitolerans]SNY87915.1 Protein of unknown function DUF262 [Nocardia amikacinitolerans]